MTNVLIIILARTGSSRLPNKVLSKIAGIPSIIYQINRINEILHDGVKLIVATTTNKNDDSLCDILKKHEIEFFRGSEDNVIERFVFAAQSIPSRFVIRINGDCPLICPKLIKHSIDLMSLNDDADYMSTIIDERFAIGMHLELIRYEILGKMLEMASTENEIEHVTPVIYNNPKIYKIFSIKNLNDDSDIRITLDYIEDLEVINNIANHFQGTLFYYADIIDYLRNNTHLITRLSRYHKSQKIIS